MNEKNLKEIIRIAETADKGYFEFCHIIACYLDKSLHEQLAQLVNGPVWDGDIINKELRGKLLSFGLAVRVCKSGEQGHTAATYLAYTVNKIITKMKAGEISA